MNLLSRSCVLLLGLLGLTTLVLAQQPDPKAILDKANARYHALQGLTADQQVSMQVLAQGRKMDINTTCTIAMARPNQYKVVWHSRLPMAPMPMNGAVWNAGQGPMIYVGMTNAYAKAGDDAKAIVAAASISQGAANTLPMVFFDFVPSGNALKDLTDLKLVGTDKVGDVPCQVVSGRQNMVGPRLTLWIGQQEPLIYKSQQVLNTGELRETMKKASDADIDKMLKDMGEAATPENRQKLRQAMIQGPPAGQDVLTTTTETFKNYKVDPTLDKQAFAYALPKGAKQEDSIEKAMGMGGEGDKEYNTKFKAGDMAPDFTAQTLDGKSIKLADYKGKVVLLDFWATWCGPCVQEMPNMIKLYQEFHPKGLQVIGISLDKDKSALQNFIKGHPGLDWPQVYDGKGWQSATAQAYGVEAIPFTVLVDPTGKIVKTDLRGPELRQAVATALQAPAPAPGKK